jgi:ArsR family transcriptional regulator
MDNTLRMFKAVANEKRLRLIHVLNKQGRMSLRDISDIMDIPETTTCRNLKILENAGLVKSEIRNAFAEYWINHDQHSSQGQQILRIVMSR